MIFNKIAPRMRWAVPAALLSVGLALSGCGSSGGAEAGGAGGSGGDGGSAGSDSTTLNVVLGTKYDVAQPALDAGLQWNVWDKYGLKIHEVTTNQGTQALATGDVDIVIGAASQVIGPIATGLKAKMIGFGQKKWPQNMIVAKDSTAKELCDLKGNKFGISGFGSSGEYSVRALARHCGWEKSSYKVVPMGSLDALIAGLKNHTIDAFAWSILPALTAQQQGYGKILGNLANAIPDTPATVLTATDEIIAEHPEAVKNFCKGFYEAQGRFMDDPDASTKMIIDDWGGDPNVTPQAVKLTIPILTRGTDIKDSYIVGATDTAKATTESAAKLTPDDVKKMFVDCNSL